MVCHLLMIVHSRDPPEVQKNRVDREEIHNDLQSRNESWWAALVCARCFHHGVDGGAETPW